MLLNVPVLYAVLIACISYGHKANIVDLFIHMFNEHERKQEMITMIYEFSGIPRWFIASQ